MTLSHSVLYFLFFSSFREENVCGWVGRWERETETETRSFILDSASVNSISSTFFCHPFIYLWPTCLWHTHRTWTTWSSQRLSPRWTISSLSLCLCLSPNHLTTHTHTHSSSLRVRRSGRREEKTSVMSSRSLLLQVELKASERVKQLWRIPSLNTIYHRVSSLILRIICGRRSSRESLRARWKAVFSKSVWTSNSSCHRGENEIEKKKSTHVLSIFLCVSFV